MTNVKENENIEQFIIDVLDKYGLEASILCAIEKAFVHSSYVNEHDDMGMGDCNERLEFLGDSFVGLIVSDLLFDEFKTVDEGKLTDYRARLVNGKVLAKIARDLKLNDYLMLGKGEASSGGKDNERNLAGLFEAFVGGVFLTVGYDETYHMLRQIYKPLIKSTPQDLMAFDLKPKLQELTQEKFLVTPDYRVINEEGPPHDKVFTVQVFIGDKAYGIGVGSSKKNAQQEAASKTLELLK